MGAIHLPVVLFKDSPETTTGVISLGQVLFEGWKENPAVATLTHSGRTYLLLVLSM